MWELKKKYQSFPSDARDGTEEDTDSSMDEKVIEWA